MCATNQDIRGVSFSDSNEPEIQKKDFVNYIVYDTDKNLPAEQFIDSIRIPKSLLIKRFRRINLTQFIFAIRKSFVAYQDKKLYAIKNFVKNL